MYADVLIQYSVKEIDKTFTYKIPNNLNIFIGNKVKVLFNNKVINGIVVNIKDSSDIDSVNEILDVVNKEIHLNNELIELGKYISKEYFCTLIKAYQTMLPSSLKINKSINNDIYDKYLVLNKDKNIILDYISNNKRSIKKCEILNDLLNNNKVNIKGLSSCYKDLVDSNLVKIEYVRKYRINNDNNSLFKYKLSDEQQIVVDSIILNKNDTYLLYGVTGSGKTICYIDIINKCINNNKTAIMLVPEISLTTQMVNRLYNSFGSNVAILHSGLSDGERYDEYSKINDGKVSVVVGTRSAIFAPLKNIGVIIIDEEHSSTYKQESTPRYNTVDIAKKRSEVNNCPLILGSATPCLESFARAKKGVYKLLELHNRALKSKLPNIVIVDMNKEVKKKNILFSDLLISEISKSLDNNKQVMILLNRRGFSTIVNCQSCGYTYKCPHCEITLTYHKSSNNLRCHYCGYTKLLDSKCPKCGEDAIRSYGTGTEKVCLELSKLFKSARIIRMDADTTTKKGSHEEYIKLIESNNVDIIVGTQMISKGLDFPNINLVGVINADESLNIPDFRSNEKTFSLINQVSGRAGRSDIDSNVIIQTFNPDLKLFSYIKDNDYVSFYNNEMSYRKKLSYPPYYYILGIKVCSSDYELASKHAKKIGNYLRNNLDNSSIILGPSTANMFKLNNIYRFQIVIKYRFDNKLYDVIKFIDNMYIHEKKVYIEIDNNPISL